MKRTSLAATVGALGLLLICGNVAAQLYHYKDASGHMVYSDTPPPPGTPAANILKAPKMTQPPPPSADAKGTDPKDKDKKTGPKSVAEQEADYKKRKAAEDKKAQEDAAKAADEQQRVARCAALQANLAALQSGQRMKKFDGQGNQSFIDDDQRAADISKAQQDMASSKCG